jgi:hypothetical protein
MAAFLLALGGCAGQTESGRVGTVSAAAARNCAFESVARVPIRVYAGLPLIDATIAGVPVRLVLDTGAVRTLLSEAAVRRIGLRRDPRLMSRTEGVGGVSAAFDARAESITLGNAKLQLSGVVVGAFTMGLAETQIDGLLGADLWRGVDVDLDLPSRTATFYRTTSCQRTAPPWQGPAVRIDGLAGPPNRLMLPAALDGRPAAAIFDTGAQVSGVSERLASGAPVGDGPVREVRMHGVGAATANFQARRFASFQVGPLLFANPVLPVMKLPRNADALVGEDMLHGCRAWFSFAARQVFLAAPGKAQDASGQITLACPETNP